MFESGVDEGMERKRYFIMEYGRNLAGFWLLMIIFQGKYWRIEVFYENTQSMGNSRHKRRIGAKVG